jgi:hypothetical protein
MHVMLQNSVEDTRNQSGRQHVGFHCSRARIVAFYLRNVCPSVALSAYIYDDPNGRISMKFDIGDIKYLSIKFEFVKIGKNAEHFQWRPNYVLVFFVTLSSHTIALFDWNGVRFVCPFVSMSACRHKLMRLSQERWTWDLKLVTFMKNVSRNSKFD